MAYVTTRGLYVPEIISQGSFLTSFTIDASGEKAAWIIQAPKTGTIDRLSFLTGTVTTGGTLDVRLETVDTATGDPSGTLWGTNTNASQVVNSADDNTWFEVTLTAGASVSRGDFIAVVLVVDASGVMNIARWNTIHDGLPYTDLFASAAWSRSVASPVGAIRYSDASYPFIPSLYPVTAVTTDNFQDSTNPDERGILFTPTFNCKVSGCWLGTNSNSANADFTARLLNTSDSILASRVVDGSEVSSGPSRRTILFDTEVTLSAGTSYRLTVKATGTASVALRRHTWNSSAAEQMPASGWGLQLTTRNNDSGSWTNTANTAPQMGLIISAVDDGAGGGGGGTAFAYGFAA